ncbi:MAG: hypothetical protein ACYDCC_09675 [Actinomycetota bacterium]
MSTPHKRTLIVLSLPARLASFLLREARRRRVLPSTIVANLLHEKSLAHETHRDVRRRKRR